MPSHSLLIKDQKVIEASSLDAILKESGLGASSLSKNVGIERRSTVHCTGFAIEHGLGFGIY
jgi:hypothetical protein